eukprot:gnl/MRDRNA2_/MRDRNA2_101935_c0_seq1.p1 gnl/MRDRNA2_/MRDRNA2_101935_c0~~gnl/MRDRNA2_/MRDRNA2_101935_c0_seq1.p1  ORF type:complete len:324 (-),score=52.40 gnl/MRDRNA2_/MRDRNA2_101935_c0_seq1:74-1045(-)
MVVSGTLPPKALPPSLTSSQLQGNVPQCVLEGRNGIVSALQGPPGVPKVPRSQFSSAGRSGIFGLSAPSHEAHGSQARFPAIHHRRPLNERSEEQQKEVHNLILRLSGNPFPHETPDPQNNGLKLAEDRGRLVVRETTQFVPPKEGKWCWTDQEAKADHKDRRQLWAESSEKESRPCAILPLASSIRSLPADHVDWKTCSKDTAPVADREELSLRLAAERRSQRAVQRNPLGGCATGRKFNRTEGREEFWTEGQHRKDGPQPAWSFPHGYDSSRGASGKLDAGDKKWAEGLLLEDMVRAKYGTDAGRIAQASLNVGGHAHTGM